MSNQPPIEVPQGAIRLNTDSQKLEFFAQDRWYEFATDSSVLDGGVGRGFVCGGNVPGGKTNGIQAINFATLATDTSFGDITSSRGGPAGAASRTRGIVAGGGEPSRVNKIDFFAMATRASAADFGDLTQGRSMDGGGLSSETRAVFAGGTTPSNVNTIDFITIASTGDAKDFGDLSSTSSQVGGVSSPTRGIFLRGNTSLEFITIASTGDAQDFGDLQSTAFGCGNGYGNAVRGEFSGGNPSTPATARQSFIFATKGNSTKFGDLLVTRDNHMSASSPTRCIIAGGTVSGAPSNQIEYVNPTTSGSAVDTNTTFANAPSGAAGLSNAHGGL
jgi:hypothetical protein